MQPASPAPQHRRLVRINAFMARQDRIVYVLLVAVAILGLAWTLWRHQHLLHQSQPSAKAATAVQQTAPTPQRQ